METENEYIKKLQNECKYLRENLKLKEKQKNNWKNLSYYYQKQCYWLNESLKLNEKIIDNIINLNDTQIIDEDLKND